MKSVFTSALREATRLVRSQNVLGATRAIQRALRVGRHTRPSDERASASSPPIELLASSTRFPGGAAERDQDTRMNAASLRSAADGHAAAQVKKPLGEVLELLRQAELPRVAPDPAPFKKTRKAPPVPKGAAYLARSFACAAGSRDYKVYVPSRGTRRERPLILMLHGCSQNSDDFALGTGMNRLAEEFNLFVAYPDQSLGANPSACWNWFKRSDQLRDLGEPSVIAGITRTLMTEFEIDPNQVYVAGLSAGGAMAAIMSTTYPELYAAAAIHSGLAYGSASDMASAFAAMRGAAPPAAQGKRHRKSAKSGVRTIVFHGASDRTVYPSNAERILTDARAGLTGLVRETQHEGWAGGRAYRRTVIADAHGVPHVEYWSVEGLGHAWSGGNPEGSYTDRRGPDASREMLRFFFEGPGRMPAR